MTSPEYNDAPAEPVQDAPVDASPQFPVQGADGDIPNANFGTPDGTTVVGPGQKDEPSPVLDTADPKFYEKMQGIVNVQYTGDDTITVGTLRLSKGDVFETSNTNALELLSGDNAANYKRA